MKILLLEDTLILNNTISEYLRQIGHMVEVFTDGQQVYDNIDNSFDLLILDINVPKKNGFEVLHSLNKKNFIFQLYLLVL